MGLPVDNLATIANYAEIIGAIAVIFAIAFGILLVAGTGFVQPNAIHEGTHDTRHAFALPCH